MDADSQAVDAMIQQAFSKALEDLVYFHSTIGSELSSLHNLFPAKSAPSLRMLSKLSASARTGAIPFFRVVIGVGKEFAESEKLFVFLNGMLEFPSKDTFETFMESGYSLLVTGGVHDEIVAAATFIVAKDGIFVGAIAVSHGKHPNACQVPEKTLEAATMEGSKTAASIMTLRTGTYQGLGLGSFLVALLARCATLRCPVHASMFLKAHKSKQSFYSHRGFEAVTSLPFLLPAELDQIVPQAYTEVSDETILMVHYPSGPPAASETTPAGKEMVDAAKVMAGLNTSPAQKPKSAAFTKQSSKKKREAAQQVVTVEVEQSNSEDEEPGDYDTYLRLPGPGNAWTLPERDYWEPQTKTFSRFKAEASEPSHQLTQKEVVAKYSGLEQNTALRRLEVIRKAREFQEDTVFMQQYSVAHARKYNKNFKAQAYINYAAVSDLNRPLLVNTSQGAFDKSTNEVDVEVSSYKVQAKMTLEKLLNNQSARAALKPERRVVTVGLPWLMETSRPEIAEWIEETIRGTKVQRIRGANAGTDALSLAFSGKMEHDQMFVSLPQGHVKNVFAPMGSVLTSAKRRASAGKAPKNKTKAPKDKTSVRHKDGSALRKTCSDPTLIYYDIQGKATEYLHKRLKDDAKALGIDFVPPPPKDNSQMVKLKWVPTPLEGKDPKNEGVWHGLYAIRLGTDKSTTVLQECGLLTDWVETQFAAPFRNECKAIAAGQAGKRNPTKFLLIPAGDVHDTDVDPPPPSEVLAHMSLTYLQGEQDTCLRDSLASALAAMGFVSEAQAVASDADLIGCNIELVQRTVALVANVFAHSNIRLKKLHSHACSVAKMAAQDAAWPILLILQTSDGCHGAHAVTTWNQMLFDSNSLHPLRWSQKSLDWCSGKDTTCVGFSRAYRLCPANEGESIMHSQISVGLHVGGSDDHPSALGWITRLPGKRKKSYNVRHMDGMEARMSKEGVVGCLVPRSTVGGL